MGVIVSCFAYCANKIKEHRSHKKKGLRIVNSSDKNDLQPQLQPPIHTQDQTQPLSFIPQHDAQLGLQDEHLAFAPSGKHTTLGTLGAQGTGEISKQVATEAPLPVPVLTAAGKMASDEDYAAFLDKVNQDPNEGISRTQSSGNLELKALDKGVEVPKVLSDACGDAWYVSDADEKFEPVVLKLEGKGLPDEVVFAKVVGHPSPKDAGVEIMDIGEWDPQGQYKEVVQATREATKGSDVRVYRIGRGGSRIEYFVVGVEGGKLIGVKALSIES